MWVMGVDHGKLLVWTQGNKLSIEKITIDSDFVASWAGKHNYFIL